MIAKLQYTAHQTYAKHEAAKHVFEYHLIRIRWQREVLWERSRGNDVKAMADVIINRTSKELASPFLVLSLVSPCLPARCP